MFCQQQWSFFTRHTATLPLERDVMAKARRVVFPCGHCRFSQRVSRLTWIRKTISFERGHGENEQVLDGITLGNSVFWQFLRRMFEHGRIFFLTDFLQHALFTIPSKMAVFMRPFPPSLTLETEAKRPILRQVGSRSLAPTTVAQSMLNMGGGVSTAAILLGDHEFHCVF